MTAHILQGKERQEITAEDISSAVSSCDHIVLDIGAGDGKGSLRYARSHPHQFVIALDSSFDALEKTSTTSMKKPSRGGVSNLMCVYSNIREGVEVLSGTADTIRVYLPWGDLLEGIADVSTAIVGAIARCGKENATVAFVINAEIWKNNLPKRLETLGEITPEFFTDRSVEFLGHGIEILGAHLMDKSEIEALDTTWSAKLMSSRDMADFVMATGVVRHTST